MRIAVIGAGIAGVTTAWELSADGHEVTVFDRRGSVAAEASFADGGLVAPGYFALRKVWRALERQRRGPFGIGAWLARTAESAERAQRESRLRSLLQLGGAARQRLQALAESLAMEPLGAGLLVLLRDDRDVARAEVALRQLESLGVDAALADDAACRRLEPGLNAETRICAALHFPRDEVGNCRQVAQALRAAAQAAGARFAFHRTIESLQAGTRWRVRHQPTPQQPASAMSAFGPHTQVADDDVPGEHFDAVVVCAGIDAAPLLQPLGLKLPTIAMFGQSVTAPLRESGLHELGPRVAIAEAGRWSTASRIGQRLRVAGAVQRGTPPRNEAAGLEPLYRLLHDWFPGAARVEQAHGWTGRITATPDGMPAIGATALPGLWLNTAHGDMGWTTACGAARLVADAIGGRSSSLDEQAFSLGRFAS